jgi:competence protein ComK
MQIINKQFSEDKIIKPETMLILPFKYRSKVYSRIIEVDKEYECPYPPFIIIKKSCLYYGMTYEGRVSGSKHLIGKHNKIPIAVDSQNSIFFFPTTSPQKDECIWIAFAHVGKYFPSGAKLTNIAFHNNKYFEVPIPYSSFDKQMLRTVNLQTTLSSNIEEAKRTHPVFN